MALDTLEELLAQLPPEAVAELTNGGEGEEAPAASAALESSSTRSPLVNYTRISPNRGVPRGRKIDVITIHCMAGDLTVEGCGSVFASPKARASSNYGIGSDGRVGCYVDEADRSWCSSSRANDDRAVTIEVANCGGAPDWKVSNAAYQKLLDLVTDICRRNGIKKLLWKADKRLIGQVDQQNMTAHRWFAAKACPGDYLYKRFGDIAAEVDRRLGTPVPPTPPVPPGPAVPYRVRVTVPELHIRSGPGTNYVETGTIRDKGVYTITVERDGPGAKKWGELKSGAGWIALDYTQRI